MKINELKKGKVYIIDLEVNSKYHKACARNTIQWYFVQNNREGDIKIFVRGTKISENYMKNKEKLAEENNIIVFIITHKINLRPDFCFYYESKIMFKLEDMNKLYIDN